MMNVLAVIAPFAVFGACLIAVSQLGTPDAALERAQYDGRTGHVFTVADRFGGKLDEVEPGTYKTVASYDLPGCDLPRGLVLDANRPYAHIACAANPALVTFDLRTHRIIAKGPYELRLREDTTASSSSSPSERPGMR